MNDAALQVLLGRYSLGIKHLIEPGPDDGQLEQMVRVALRAPDHGGLVPFRFSVIRRDARTGFGELLECASLAAGE